MFYFLFGFWFRIRIENFFVAEVIFKTNLELLTLGYATCTLAYCLLSPPFFYLNIKYTIMVKNEVLGHIHNVDEKKFLLCK